MLLHNYQAVIITIALTAFVGMMTVTIDGPFWAKVFCLIGTPIMTGYGTMVNTYEYQTDQLTLCITRPSTDRLHQLRGPRFTGVEDSKTVQTTEDDNTVIAISDELYAPTTVCPVADMFADYSSDYALYGRIEKDAQRLLDENRQTDAHFVERWNTALKTSHDAQTCIKPMLLIIRKHPRFTTQQHMYEMGRQTRAVEQAAQSAKDTAGSANTMAIMSLLKS